MDNNCCLWPQPAEIDVTSSSCQHSLYRLHSATCLLEVLSLPPADEKSNNKHNVIWHYVYFVFFTFCLCCIHHYELISGLSPTLPQTDRAVQLLLETSADNPSYYCDSLKACLVTTITSSGPSQSTIKLVATNMIANGKLAGSICVADSC